MIKNCISCGQDFDTQSAEKRRAGGRITECAECSVEPVVRYAGVQAADGKQAQATILKFDTNEDRNKYLDFWKVTSGLYKGKSCQLSKTAPTTPAVSFQTITAFNPTNHKGKNT